MAIVIQVEWEDFTSEQYERVISALGLDENPAQGMIFHAAAFDDDGAHITDVWESEAALGAFMETRFMAALAEAEVQGTPPFVVRSVHNVVIP